MLKIKFDSKVNYLGELADKDLENEFLKEYLLKSAGYIKSIVLSLGILNTLFLVPDYYLVENFNSFIFICSSRIIFVFLVLLFYIFIKYVKTFKLLSYLVTAYEFTCIMLFIFILYKYESPNYLIQSFGVMVIILGIFLVPNRWINKICVSLILIFGFNLFSMLNVFDIQLRELLSVITYSIIVLILSSINSFRDDYHKRVQYINNKELIRLSTTDPLTGLCNRTKINEEFKFCLEYSRRYNSHISLIMIDIDNFKRINDTFGHTAGDNVILKFVRIVSDNIREVDILARWGGEEFVILLPNTDIGCAIEIAERLRSKIEAYTFEEVNNATCSFGVAQSIYDDDIDSLIQKADKMLYVAKSSGKNIVKGYYGD